MKEYEFHEVANIFPLLEGKEYDAFVEDIRVNGQKDDIILHEGKIIDGRNRYRACHQLGIAPKTKEWDGKGLLIEFVTSVNLHRRHLTTNQKGICGVACREKWEDEMKNRMREGGKKGGISSGKIRSGRVGSLEPTLNKSNNNKNLKKTKCGKGGRASEEIAKMLGTSRATIDRARQVFKSGSEKMIDAIKSESIGLTVAATLASKLPQKKQDELISAGPKAIASEYQKLRTDAQKRNQKKRPRGTPELIQTILDAVEELIKQIKQSEVGVESQRNQAISELRFCRDNVKKCIDFLF